MTRSSGGFELRGDDGDETRLLVHPARGYAIAIPGRPRLTAPTTESPRYDVLVALADAPAELGFRMDEVPTAIAPDALAASLTLAYATSRADAPASLAPNELQGNQRARGANAASVANYGLRGEDARAMEFLAVTAKAAASVVHALHMTVRYRRVEMTPFDWANLRAALLTHQSWTDGVLPETQIWPASELALPSAKLQLSAAANAEAHAKARDIGAVDPAEANQLADLLLAFASGNEAPTIPMHPFVHQMTSRRVVACVPQIAEVLLRNISGVMSVHDLRAWCWQCYWAVENRAGLTKVN